MTELRRGVALPSMARAGTRLREGLASQALAHGFEVRQTGPVQMPMIAFAGDSSHRRPWSSS
jgi:glutamate-1-semialdehyde 2,1-aminomutase